MTDFSLSLEHEHSIWAKSIKVKNGKKELWERGKGEGQRATYGQEGQEGMP